jgi:hypothetical protein
MKREPVSIGRIVHYTSLGSAPQGGVQEFPSVCRAAIVTSVIDVSSGAVTLTVFNPTGDNKVEAMFDVEYLGLNGSATPGRWHWPERASAPLVGGAEAKEL